MPTTAQRFAIQRYAVGILTSLYHERENDQELTVIVDGDDMGLPDLTTRGMIRALINDPLVRSEIGAQPAIALPNAMALSIVAHAEQPDNVGMTDELLDGFLDSVCDTPGFDKASAILWANRLHAEEDDTAHGAAVLLSLTDDDSVDVMMTLAGVYLAAIEWATSAHEITTGEYLRRIGTQFSIAELNNL